MEDDDRAHDSVQIDLYTDDPDGVITHGTTEETTLYPGPPPPNQPRYVWREAEASKTPIRFRDRILLQFRSPQNVKYLRKLFAMKVPAGKLQKFAVETTEDAVLNFGGGFDRASDILLSDNLARRGFTRRAADFWSEVRRLNREFFDDRMRFFIQGSHMIDPQPIHDGVGDDDEQYHMRMFEADSLRPPGLEFLNDPGPLWAIREDQSTWQPAHITSTGRAARRNGGRAMTTRPCAAANKREGFTSAPSNRAAAAAPQHRDKFASGDWELKIAGHYPKDDIHQLELGQDDARRPRITDRSRRGEHEDEPWDEGNPNRTATEALAEYWGDDHPESVTQLGSKTRAGVAYGGLYAWGDDWQDNGGTRFMRYDSIPFWQKGGHEGYDYDIEENLGTQMREADGHVRRWDMDRMRQPQGQQYRTYGPRSGPIV
jgi:hypothetical protein